MEGNACYKYRTVSRFIAENRLEPVRTILDIGVNVGDILLELAAEFPDAAIHGYEVIEEHAERARARTAHLERVSIDVAAVTAAHKFEDELGRNPRDCFGNVSIYYSRIGKQISYVGESGARHGPKHVELSESPICITLDEVIESTIERQDVSQVDYVKTDCEGSERSFLGCASNSTIEKIRYLAGEYHDLPRFWPIVERLFETHYVALIGKRKVGSFFCERHTDGPTLLSKTPLPTKMCARMHDIPIHWHPFDERWIPPGERWIHGYPKRQQSPSA